MSIRTARNRQGLASLAIAFLLISARVAAIPNQNTQSQSKSPTMPPKLPRALVDVKLIGSKEGADFDSYLKNVYVSVRHNFLSDVPDSFMKGEKGVVVVRLQIQRDGTLSEKSLAIVSSTGTKDMDEAALRAIRTTAPFVALPKEYTKPNIDLQFRFFYNTSPPEPAQ